MKAGQIRPLAICVFSHRGRILVAEGYDPLKGQLFYRPLGGAIEFGEPSRQTLVRELREELAADIAGLRYLGALENIFTYDGRPGHEIVQVYDGRFASPALYEQASLPGYEEFDRLPFTALWKSLDDFRRPAAPPLYPDGLLELLDRTLGLPL